MSSSDTLRRRSVPLALSLTLALGCFAAAGLQAQVSTHTLEIGGAGAQGCQLPGNPPLLTGGVPAAAEMLFSYDRSTAILDLTVTNTSPVLGGDATPVITKLYLNLPTWAISSASLISAAGSGGATPSFVLAYDTDLMSAPTPISANCFGDFGVFLEKTAGGISGGIARDGGNTPGSAGSTVIGPVTFQIQLAGPGVGTLNAEAIATAYSYNANGFQVAAAMKFQGGGPGGDESGTIGAVENCTTSSYLLGEPRLGQTVGLTLAGPQGCYGCLVASFNPGPSFLGGQWWPIGFPIYEILVGYTSDHAPMLLTIPLPQDPIFVNLTLYFLLIQVDPVTYVMTYAEPFSMTILP